MDDSFVLLVSTRTETVEAVRRVVAATTREVEVVAAVEISRRWRRAALVLIGVDALAEVMCAEPLRRPRVYVVATAPVAEPVWREAVAVGAEDVVVLPAADDWLVEQLRSTDDLGTGAPVVGVVGGRGGCGASFLAAALACCSARGGGRGRRPSAVTGLVDLDRLGGGIDLLLGPGDDPGLRWPDLAGVRGRVPWDSLAESLPSRDGVTVVTFDRTVAARDPESSAVRAVVSAARLGCGLVLVDLPRSEAAVAARVLGQLDRVVVVTTADVRGALGARSVVREVRDSLDDVLLAVRRPARGGLPTAVLEEVAGIATSIDLPELTGADRRIGRGRPGFGTGASLRRVLEQVVAGLEPTAAGRAA